MYRTLQIVDMENVKIMPRNALEEVTQNIETICLTPRESVPMCREIGISVEPLHRRENYAKVLLTRDIYVAVQDQENRATVHKIRHDQPSKPGQVIPVMEVDIDV